ncbi:MAG: nucleoside monophosphate kinase [Defluviitaleaceae bacterium]|nr:nucleoside monophosphate kinase [Defluviitaleaceae bacterium]
MENAHENEQTPILGKWDFIFLLGESGGGKGTLVKNIKKYLFPDIYAESMGDIFRKKSQTDPDIKRLTDEGILIGDEIVHEIFKEFVHNNYGGIIDGYPRNRNQTLEAVKLLKKIGWRVLVIDIHCRMETILERLFSRGRPDDSLEIMYKRNLAHKTLHPAVMEEIRNRHDVFDVIDLDGNKGADMVFSELLLSLLRYVDLLDLYDKAPKAVTFKVSSEETTIDAAINRILTSILLDIQKNM